MKRIYTAVIRPRFEYACAVWTGRPTGRLQRLQDSFAKDTHFHSLLRFEYHALGLFYRVRANLATTYLSSLVPPLTFFFLSRFHRDGRKRFWCSGKFAGVLFPTRCQSISSWSCENLYLFFVWGGHKRPLRPLRAIEMFYWKAHGSKRRAGQGSRGKGCVPSCHGAIE